MELRSFITEVRAAETMRLSGIAVPWDSPSSDLGGGVREVIRRGAFSEQLSDPTKNVFVFWSHAADKPLASRAAGSLTLRDEPGGLYFEAKLSETSWARDAWQAIKAGDSTGVSIGFYRDDWKPERIGGHDMIVVTKGRLLELSPCCLPMYADTYVAARSKGVEAGITLRDQIALGIELEIERAR